MAVTTIKYKRPVILNIAVQAADISAGSVSVQLDTDPLTVFKTFTGIERVRSSVGLEKTGYTYVYNVSGVSAGYLQISGTYATGDTITVIGSLNLV